MLVSRSTRYIMNIRRGILEIAVVRSALNVLSTMFPTKLLYNIIQDGLQSHLRRSLRCP
jgi:hypothetical protein